MDDLWRWSATELATGIRTGQVSAEAAARSCLDRIAEVNPALNALSGISEPDTLAAARRADEALAAGEEVGPLHGVPVAVKINTEQTGHATSMGVTAFADTISDGDAFCVAGLRAAGAVMLGRSNSPAFALRWFSTNDLHGRTLSPWDPARTPGGSSGGASSALASGMVPLAQANDIGGSIRYPSYCCGVVGLRPTVGRMPVWSDADKSGMDSPLSSQCMAVHGPMARTVADVKLAFEVMSTVDLRDPFSVPAPAARRPGSGTPAVGVVRDVGLTKPHPSVDAALSVASERLERAGYLIEEIELPLLAEAARLWSLLVIGDIGLMMPAIEEFGDDALRESLTSQLAVRAEIWGDNLDFAAYGNGMARRGTLITQLQQLLGSDRLLLTPVSAEPPFEQDADLTGPDRTRELIAAQWPMTSVPVLGFPAIAVPTGVHEGLPTGVQLIGGRFEEDLLFDAAAVIENATGRLTPVEPVGLSSVGVAHG